MFDPAGHLSSGHLGRCGPDRQCPCNASSKRRSVLAADTFLSSSSSDTPAMLVNWKLLRGVRRQILYCCADLNTMAHGIARLSRHHCNDVMRWRSLGYSEAQWWDCHVLAAADTTWDPSSDQARACLHQGSRPLAHRRCMPNAGGCGVGYQVHCCDIRCECGAQACLDGCSPLLEMQ